jgi:hypothetical protein
LTTPHGHLPGHSRRHYVIENNEDQSRTLAEIRDALLPKLLSGEIRATNTEKAFQPSW